MKATIILATCLAAVTLPVCAADLHVSATKGDDTSDGSQAKPFKTIMAAARKAEPGDTVLVHAGTYREWVKPPKGGTDDAHRITYAAAPGEKAVITGSDVFSTWEKVSGDQWKLVIPKARFGDFNPYAEKVFGDWFIPKGRTNHRGNIYLNGEWLTEALNLDGVTKGAGAPCWFPSVAQSSDGAGDTTIYARFPAGTDPNSGAVEVCMRPSVFTPEKTEINWITVRGFDLRNAATNWCAPTTGQRALVTAYWDKGWIIEDNEISYSRCCGIALGKYSDQWDNKRGNTAGQLLTVAAAIKDGWSKERIGSHIVRRNHIHHCGQTGIVGHLGCAFSRIIGNDIHDCNMQGIWSGAEMAGIKLHAAVDVVIADNHIWRNGMHGGLWLDWMAQGTRVTGNLFHGNAGADIFCEVDHGPVLIANNLFLSAAGGSNGSYTAPSSVKSNSHGLAVVHNFVTGPVKIGSNDRSTPYMEPHGTTTLGKQSFPLGDARWFNNILSGVSNLAKYGQNPVWPCTFSGNVYAKGAIAAFPDAEAVKVPEFNPGAKLVKKEDGWYLTLAADKGWKDAAKRKLVTTELLGKAKVPQQEFTLPDGSPMAVDTDYFGKKRDDANPFPGPFEAPAEGEVKVWPKN